MDAVGIERRIVHFLGVLTGKVVSKKLQNLELLLEKVYFYQMCNIFTLAIFEFYQKLFLLNYTQCSTQKIVHLTHQQQTILLTIRQV